MDDQDHGFKRLACLAIAIGVVIFLAFAFESGEANWFVYLIGAVFGGVAVFGFFRPDLVNFEGE